MYGLCNLWFDIFVGSFYLVESVGSHIMFFVGKVKLKQMHQAKVFLENSLNLSRAEAACGLTSHTT